ncbi:MAG: VTT domain-containing protein [Hyphomonadaceae bacterium]
MSGGEVGASTANPSERMPGAASSAGAKRKETLGEKAERLAGSNKAMGLLAAVSIAESALLPLPVDAVALPMMAASRHKIPLIIFIAAVTSIVGGLLGYLIGVFGMELIGNSLVNLFNQGEEFAKLKVTIQENWLSGAGIIFLGAVTPVPFKLVCIGSGATGFPFWIFLPVALTGRVLRFAIFGAIFWFFGPAAAQLMRKHGKLVGLAMLVLIILGFVVTPLLL